MPDSDSTHEARKVIAWTAASAWAADRAIAGVWHWERHEEIPVSLVGDSLGLPAEANGKPKRNGRSKEAVRISACDEWDNG